MNMNQPRLVRPNPADSERIIAGFCEFADVPYRDAFETDEVVSLLRGVGYEVNLNTLAEFVRKGYISEPSDVWTAIDVHCLAAALDVRRRWLPSPNQLHDCKKSAARLQIEAARAEGLDVFDDVEGYSLEDLLLQLAGCDQRQLREALYEAVKVKLAALGVVEE